MIEQPLLSILVPTVPGRVAGVFCSLIEELTRQADGRSDVEVIGMFDNRSRVLGDKRNAMLKLARAKYLMFVDDDDRVHPDIVEKLCAALTSNVTIDLLLFDIQYETPWQPPCICHYDLSYRPRRFVGTPPMVYFGPPAHTHVWRTDLVQGLGFPSIGYGEDMPWCEAAASKVKVQEKIEEVLYWYQDNPATSESRRPK